jgi:hypothetical protein
MKHEVIHTFAADIRPAFEPATFWIQFAAVRRLSKACAWAPWRPDLARFAEATTRDGLLSARSIAYIAGGGFEISHNQVADR